MAEHDESYKLLFSHPAMVADLLTGFVKEPWVARADLSTLERANGSYVTEDLREREEDIIWRLRVGEDWLYVYLLIEFQSTVEQLMAVRVMGYESLLYQDLVRTGAIKPRPPLPPIVPIVLYNGSDRWTAALDVADLVQDMPGGLEQYRPQARYLLLAESRFAESELAPLRNLVAALFRLENGRTPDDIRRVLDALIEWVSAPEMESLRQAFTVWMRRVLLPRRLPGVSLPEISDLKEVGGMLEARVKEWTREWREQGIQQGIQQGERQGQATMLVQMMERRFGALPEHIVQRVRSADSETLTTWALLFVTADRIEDVFA